MRFLAFAVSLVVAVSGAVEEFFHYGERWRQYRGTAELLMTEGWRFLQLSNDYAHFASQTEGYKLFAGRVEAILEQDMHSYLTKVAGAKEDRTRPAAARAK